MLTHTDWLEVVNKTVLQDVSVSMEDYIDTITTPGVLLDFIAITVLCRAYHMHVSVFTSDAIWMTSINKKLESCLFGLASTMTLNFQRQWQWVKETIIALG